MSNEVAMKDSGAVVTQQPGELSISQVLGQLAKIQDLMRQAMVKDVDYGTIPGTPKPTLYKPGADKLCLMFRLDPEYEMVKDIQDGNHLSIVSRCVLYHIPTGARMGSGMGSCSTHEKKYAYRDSGRSCPECGVDAIKKGAAKYGGGYYCDGKSGGCGEKFKGADDRIALIEDQEAGKIENPDMADQWNTVLKMANKRAQVAAVLNVTGASQIFTQDVEDFARKAARASAGDGAGSVSQSVTAQSTAVDERPAPSRLKPTDKAPAAKLREFFDSIKKKFMCDDDHAKLLATGWMHDVGVLDAKRLTVGDLQKMMTKMLEATAAEAPDPFAGNGDEDLQASFDKEHPVDG